MRRVRDLRERCSTLREEGGTPIGQVVGRMNQLRPAKDVIYEMVDEYIDTMSRLNQTFSAS